MSEKIPVAGGLFAETSAGPRLLGSRCSSCSTPYFPKVSVCRNPDCGAPDIEDAEFGPSGTIWSVARQDYPPPAPVKFDEPYTPFAMGVVDMEDGLRVLGRIAVDDPTEAECGMPVELIIDTLAHDENGNELVSWKFKPVG